MKFITNFLTRLKALFHQPTFDEILKELITEELKRRSRPTPLKNEPPIGPNEVVMYELEFEEGGTYSIPVVLQPNGGEVMPVTENEITKNKDIQ